MISKDKDLDLEFQKHVEIANNLPPQAADNMLVAYAYYKQATAGDNLEKRPTESSNVIQTFKHDAWKRLQGMSKEEAKKRYIKAIAKLSSSSKH